MARVLITAFGPYDEWQENASWLALVRLTADLPRAPVVATRRYPVDFAAVHDALAQDLTAGYDYAIHLGQAPGIAAVHLEAIAINVRGDRGKRPEEFGLLAPDGPAAYRVCLPLADWARKIRAAGIPAAVSYHAGTYLCNAALYWSHYFAERNGWPTKAAFIHVPLDVSQTIGMDREAPAMPAEQTANAIRLILEELA